MVAGLVHKKIWLKKLRNILTSEAILQPSQTSMTDHSCRNSQRLKVVNYFRRKAPPQMFLWALNILLYLIWLTYQKIKKRASAPTNCINKKQQTYLPNTVYLSNQIWKVRVSNAARIIQKLILPKSYLKTNIINNNIDNNNNNNNHNNNNKKQ